MASATSTSTSSELFELAVRFNHCRRVLLNSLYDEKIHDLYNRDMFVKELSELEMISGSIQVITPEFSESTYEMFSRVGDIYMDLLTNAKFTMKTLMKHLKIFYSKL